VRIGIESMLWIRRPRDVVLTSRVRIAHADTHPRGEAFADAIIDADNH